ncbi:MAG: M23 family metallopeptidase [Pseudomonadota bacterium]
MQKRLVLSSAVAAAALISACDGRVAFPGFSAAPEPEETSEAGQQVPPPPISGDENPSASPPPPPPSTDVEDDPETVSEDSGDDLTEDLPSGSDEEPEPEQLPPSPPPDPEPETEPEPEPEPEPPAIVEPAFSYYAPGFLISGSGQGSLDETVYSPDMMFPIKDAPAYAQSQVFRFGGGIGGGDECDPRNYEYPWQDNFCETRSRNNSTAGCPLPRVHLGQDIRVGDAAACQEMRREYRDNPAGISRYKIVAVEDGIISNIGSYTVNLRAGPRIYRYMHMNMRALQVSLGDEVKAGQHIGYYSKDFGGTPTTFHLHFEIKQNTPDGGWEFVPPYTSLVEAYARRESGPGERIEQNVAVASDTPLIIPEGIEITEGFVSDEYQ